MADTVYSTYTWVWVGVIVLILLALGLGLWGDIMLTLFVNQNTFINTAVSNAACSDGNPATADVVLRNQNLCQHYTLPNGASCTSEGANSCYETCTVQNGQPTGTCIGTNAPTFYDFFPADCPIPIFKYQVQAAIYYGQVFYMRDSFLGKCRTYIEYTFGDMDAPMGRAFAFFLLNQFSRLPYDPLLEQQCLGLISNDDPTKQCWQAVVHWQYSTVTSESVFMCEFTMKCADDATMDYFGDIPDQLTFFGTEAKTNQIAHPLSNRFSAKTGIKPRTATTTNVKTTENVKQTTTNQVNPSSSPRKTSPPARKRSLQDIVPNPNNISSYWFPKSQIQNQLAGNVTALQEWWSSLPSIPDGRGDWPVDWRANNTFQPKYDHELPEGSPQWCLFTFYKTTVGVHFSVINDTLYTNIVTDLDINVPDILNNINDVDNFGEMFYFYSFLYQEFLLGDLCPCC